MTAAGGLPAPDRSAALPSGPPAAFFLFAGIECPLRSSYRPSRRFGNAKLPEVCLIGSRVLGMCCLRDLLTACRVRGNHLRKRSLAVLLWNVKHADSRSRERCRPDAETYRTHGRPRLIPPKFSSNVISMCLSCVARRGLRWQPNPVWGRLPLIMDRRECRLSGRLRVTRFRHLGQATPEGQADMGAKDRIHQRQLPASHRAGCSEG
jgi:hypothetical protein